MAARVTKPTDSLRGRGCCDGSVDLQSAKSPPNAYERKLCRLVFLAPNNPKSDPRGTPTGRNEPRDAGSDVDSQPPGPPRGNACGFRPKVETFDRAVRPWREGPSSGAAPISASGALRRHWSTVRSRSAVNSALTDCVEEGALSDAGWALPGEARTAAPPLRRAPEEIAGLAKHEGLAAYGQAGSKGEGPTSVRAGVRSAPAGRASGGRWRGGWHCRSPARRRPWRPLPGPWPRRC